VPRSRIAGAALLRPGEKALLGTAGLVFALASAGAAMSAAAADALFLAEIGPSKLGIAVAASSALLAGVLAVVGGLADRLERRRVLALLALTSACVLAVLGAFSTIAPRPVAVLALVGGKQLAAATDLAFWVVLAERLDARRSQRLLPLIAAMGGLGAAVGAGLVIPIARTFGARGVLACAAVVLACAAFGATRLEQTRRAAQPVAKMTGIIGRSWRDGARAVRRNSLAKHMAFVVAAAGVFASLAYFALAVEVAARGGSTAQFAEVLGAVRGGAQLATLIVQLLLTSRLLNSVGTGRALLVAPFVALMAGVGLVIAPILAVAIATQSSAKVLDSAIETPAEKLAQTLLPVAIRGRVAGFLEGTAKRFGSVLGGITAALLASRPSAFYGVTAGAAVLWLIAAVRTSRALPSLAVEHVVEADDADAAVDAQAITVLVDELQSPRPDRAAEVLARLHERGNVDAVGPLVEAASKPNARPAVWRALIRVLDTPAETHGPALAALLPDALPATRELVVRAIGLCGGNSPELLAPLRKGNDAKLAFAAEIAALRLANDDDAVIALLGDAVRDKGPTGRVAITELSVSASRALAMGGDGAPRALEAARHLVRALKRRRGDVGSRQGGYGALGKVVEWARDRRDGELSLLRADLLELVRERVDSAASSVAPDTALTSLVRPEPAIVDEAPEVAAALRLYGQLLDGADVVDEEDLRRISRALGEPDDDVRAAAEASLVALGAAAAGELIATVAWGRRRARDRAAVLLAELPVTAGALDRLIDAELEALEQTQLAIAVLVQPGDELLARRLDERLQEIAHTVLLLVAARRRSRAIARAAIAWRHARGRLERARTLAVVDAALPRKLVGRLVDAVDDLTPTDRAAQLTAAGTPLPAREAVIREELAGRDRLARGIALHILGSAGRSAHRDHIANAARAEASAANPSDLLRRLSEAPVPTDGDDTDMPSRVETLIALGKIPLLASLSTRQLADVAERARWAQVAQGSVIVTAGDPIDALIFVDDGALAIGDRAIGKGEVVDELAPFAPTTIASDLRALKPTRMVRLERVDLEELVDDVPGLAAAVCRGLGERARRVDEPGYRSPLATTRL
jgi:AAA family ATP:ADP antiporter